MSKPGLDWKKISIAIVLLVLVRGVFVLSVLPPFEGWDEYQHVAYIIYLGERRELPTFARSKVPRSMAPMMSRYPHSATANPQHRRWGTKPYDTFWTETREESGPVQSDIALYESQQTPLYYLVALPFWIAFSYLGELAAIYGLRLINVVFLAAAVFVFLQTLAQSIPNLRHRLIVALLVASYPMYMITAARVTNCALSILFGALTLHYLSSAIKQRPFRNLILATCFLGLGILTKATLFIMIPVLFGTVVFCAFRHKLSIRASFKTLAVCTGLLVVFLLPLLVYKYRTTGAVYLMAQQQHLRDKSIFWLLPYFFKVGWSTQIREWIFTRDLWASGWSNFYLPGWIVYPHKAFQYFFWFLVVALGLKRGWSRRPPTRRPEYLFGDDGDLLIFACTLLFMVLGLAYFATVSLADYGTAMSMPSYFMIALPAWTALVYQAALWVGARVAFWFANIIMAFYVASELVGTLYVMPRIFTGSTWSVISWNRLVQMHPFFPGPWFIAPSLLISAGLLFYLVRTLWQIKVGPATYAEAGAG